MNKFTIGIINEGGDGYTGTSYYLKNLAKELQNMGQDARIITPVKIKNLEVKQDIYPWKIINWPIVGRPSWYLSLYFRLSKKKYDIIHSFGYGIMQLTPINRLRDSLKVTSIADVMCDKKEMRGRSFVKWFLAKILQPPHINFNDIIITTSNYSEKEIRRIKNVKNKEIFVVYHGVDPIFRKKVSKKEVKKLLKKYNLPKKFILNTGSVKPNKNILNAIKAFEIYSKKNPDTYFVMTGKLGKDKYDLDIEKYLKNMPKNIRSKIIFLNFISYEDLIKLYHASTIFFMPSLEEGFGMPILEAMSSGKPVVTSNASCMPEISQNAAILCNPYSPSNMAKKLELAMKQDKYKIRRGLTISKSFTWKKTAKETYEVYIKSFNKKTALGKIYKKNDVI